MSDSSAERNPVDRLAEEFAERLRRGERPSLTEYVERYPQHADEIRELFPALVLMEQLQPASHEQTGPYAAPAGGQTPERLGEYRILREVGRGGMGVVYEAEQVSLGRRVALKVLPGHALLDAQRLERFRREARAAAKLHHTNIVPVFGVGEAGGLHYYAMQFISGLGLDQVLDEVRKLRRPGAATPQAVPGPTAPGSAAEAALSLLSGRFAAPTAVDQPPPPLSGSATDVLQRGSGVTSSSGREYWQSVARIGVQVAEALAHAHSHGVLHRDIKPSNLLLDAQGVVWVADFGLAKTEDDANLTNAGDIVGTLRYMAPERFEGHCDQRADIYALGLTLYEMLTFRAAFEEAGREQLIAQVTQGEPLRPSRINREVPRDLETVVLKAIARDPAVRYASAAEMAADLQLYLEDRPILARRVTATERLVRWSRRNPVVASLAGVSAVLLVALAVAAGAAAFSFRTLAETQTRAKADIQTEQNRLLEERDRLRQANGLLDNAARHQVNKEWALALFDCDAAVAVQPDNAQVRAARGQLLLRLGLADEAAADFARLFKIHPPSDPSKWFTHACLLLNKGDREQYRDLCRAMLKHFPNPGSAELIRWVVATCTLAPGAVEDPEALVRLVEKAEGQDLTVERWAALYRADRYGEALVAVTSFNVPGHEATRALLLALLQHVVKPGEDEKRSLASARDTLDDKARVLAQQPLTDDPGEQVLGIYPPPAKEDDTAGWLAELLLYREASAIVLGDSDADSALPHVIRARAFAVLGRAGEARAAADRAIALRPEFGYFYLDRARVLALQGNWPEAEKDLAAAVAHTKPPPPNPGVPPTTIPDRVCFDVARQAGRLAVHYRRWEAAEAYLLRARTVMPAAQAEAGGVDFNRLLAQTYVARKNWDGAGGEYAAALQSLDAIYLQGTRWRYGSGRQWGDDLYPPWALAPAPLVPPGFRPDGMLDPHPLRRVLEQEIASRGELFDRVAARRGHDSSLWLARAHFLAQGGDTDGAAAVFLKALEAAKQPRNPAVPPVILTGTEPLILELTRWDALFDKVVAALPGEPGLWLARCRRHVTAGRWDAAADDWHKAVAALPAAPALRPHTYDLAAANDQLFRKLRAPATDDPELWLTRARALGARKEYDEADTAFARALELKPDVLNVWVERARARLLQGKPGEARQVLEELLRRKPTDGAALASVMQMLREYKLSADAVALCDSAITAAPKNPQLLMTRAELLAGQGQWQKAIDDYKAALDLLPREIPPNPAGGLAPTSRPTVYWMILNDDQARQHVFPAVAESRPKDDAQPWLARGAWGMSRGPTYRGAAIADFQKAVECEPENAYGQLALARACAADSQWDKAAAAYLKLFDLFPNGMVPGPPGQTVPLRTELARLDGNLFTRVADKRPDDVGLWWERASFLMQSNRPAEAEAALDRLATRVAPKLPAAWVTRSNFLVTRKEWDKAADGYVKALELLEGKEPKDAEWIVGEVARHPEVLERVVAKWPKDARLLTARGQLLAAQGVPVREFEASFAKALALKPNDPATLLARAWAYAGRALWKEAAADFTASRAGKDFTGDSMPSMAHAAVLLASGDTEGYRSAAARMFERFDDPDSLNDALHTALVCSLLPGGAGDTGTLLFLAERAYGGNPQAPWNIYVLALAEYRAGRFEKAAARLKEGLKPWGDQATDPNPTMMLLVRAMAQARLGKAEEARADLKKATQAMARAFPSDAEKSAVIPGGSHHVWPMCVVLRSEVEALLKAEPVPAPKEETP